MNNNKTSFEQNLPLGLTNHDLFKYGKIVSFFGFVYLAGYMNWSISWLIVLIVAMEIREARREGAKIKSTISKAISQSEQNALKGRLVDDLTWVYFPDTEFAEWINVIIKQCWPNVNNYFKVFMVESMEASLRETLESFNLKCFKFKRIILGDTPVRIINVSVNEENSSNAEIVLDLDLYYSGNCNITFVVSGAKGGISNFQLHGLLRVVMSPLISEMPLIGGIQCFFLNNPDLKFDIDGALSVLKMPGLRDNLNKAVIDQIAYMMVLPNKYVLKLSDDVDLIRLMKPNPKGVLRVHVIEAKDLMVMDRNLLGTAKSDPFAVLNVDIQENRTNVITNTLDPKWDYWCDFIVYEPDGQQLHLKLLDKDDAAEEFMGRYTIYIRNIKRKGTDDLWVTLAEASRGKVHLRLTWFDLTTEIRKLEKIKEENEHLKVDNLNMAVLTIYIDSCSNLPKFKSVKPDPFVTITCGKTTKETYVAASTIEPAWNQSFTFLVPDPTSSRVNFKIKDRRAKNILGELEYHLDALLKRKDLALYQETLCLEKENTSARMKLSMFLQILERPKLKVIPEQKFQKSNKIETIKILEKIKTENQTILPIITEQMTKSPPEYCDDDNDVFLDVQNSSEDEMVDNTIELEKQHEIMTASNENIITSNQTLIPHSSQPQNVGKILLTITYNVDRQRLIVVIHRVINIPSKSFNDKPDPYVKTYLLPHKSKDTKRKTDVRKDSCNPTFNEIFEYLLSQSDLSSHKLEVSVCTRTRKRLSRNVLGQVVVDLFNIYAESYNKVWFDLYEV